MNNEFFRSRVAQYVIHTLVLLILWKIMGFDFAIIIGLGIGMGEMSFIAKDRKSEDENIAESFNEKRRNVMLKVIMGHKQIIISPAVAAGILDMEEFKHITIQDTHLNPLVYNVGKIIETEVWIDSRMKWDDFRVLSSTGSLIQDLMIEGWNKI